MFSVRNVWKEAQKLTKYNANQYQTARLRLITRQYSGKKQFSHVNFVYSLFNDCWWLVYLVCTKTFLIQINIEHFW